MYSFSLLYPLLCVYNVVHVTYNIPKKVKNKVTNVYLK